MENLGQLGFLFILMLGVLLFFLGVAIAPALNETVQEVRSGSIGSINCSNASLGSFEQGHCLTTDLFPPMYVGIIFGIAGIIIGGLSRL